MKSIYVMVFMFVSSYAIAQKANTHYLDKYQDEQGIFTFTEIPPTYKSSFILFLLKNGHYDKVYEVVDSLKSNINKTNRLDKFTYKDTAEVKFILSRDLVMSDLTVKNLKSDAVKKDLIRIVKLSAPHWRQALMSGRPVNCWVNILVYYTIEGKRTPGLFDNENLYNNDEKLNIDYKIVVKN